MKSSTLPVLSNDAGLANYLAEIRKFPVLSHEEEMRLGKLWRDHQDREAVHILVTSHLRLVAKLAMGNGIILPGGYNNLVLRNQVWNHERVGIALVPFPEDGPKDDIPTGDELKIPCSEARNLPLADKASLPGTVLWDAIGNRVEGNTVSTSGIADLAFGTLTGSEDPLGNCFTGNAFSSSAPASIETSMACTSPAGSWTNTLDLVALIGSARPDSGDYKVQPVPPAQPNMPDATTAPGQPAVNLPAKIDIDSIPLPTKP
jgi:hypothetical protein